MPWRLSGGLRRKQRRRIPAQPHLVQDLGGPLPPEQLKRCAASRHLRQGLLRRRQPDQLRAAEARRAIRRRDRRRSLGADVPQGGPVEPFDPADLSTWDNLYSVAREVPFWTKGRSTPATRTAGRRTSSITTRPRSRPRRTPGRRCSTRATAARSCCQGAERHHGQGRLRDRGREAVRHDRGRDRAGQGLPERAEAEHPQLAQSGTDEIRAYAEGPRS